MSAPRPYNSRENCWSFNYRGGNHTLHESVPLRLVPEVEYAPVEDDYAPDEVDAWEMFDIWRREVQRAHERRQESDPYGFGDVLRDGDLLAIHWWVDSIPRKNHGHLFSETLHCTQTNKRYARARARGTALQRNDFEHHFTRPVNAVTGEPINWSRLPVGGGVWSRRDPMNWKGSYIYEATGWRPGPFQSEVSLRLLAECAEVERARITESCSRTSPPNPV